MLKLLFVFSVLSLSSLVLARPCQVYGISDSPQALTCIFPTVSVKLSCVKGQYFLNQHLVSLAFHLEVEDGTVPLVFKAQHMTLTVLMDQPIAAELETAKGQLPGTCR